MNNRGNSYGRARAEAKDGAAAGMSSGARKTSAELAGAAGNVSGREMAKREVADLAGIPEGVRASAASKPGEYDGRRLRSQREIIRDVMVSAADCETWLTLGECGRSRGTAKPRFRRSCGICARPKTADTTW